MKQLIRQFSLITAVFIWGLFLVIQPIFAAQGSKGIGVGLTVTHAESVIISNVSVVVTDDSADLTWDTNVSSTCKVFYGKTGHYEKGTIVETQPSSSHSVTISDLTQATKYKFKLYCWTLTADGEEDGFSFKTKISQPKHDWEYVEGKWKVRLFGETESNWEVHVLLNYQGSTVEYIVNANDKGKWSLDLDSLPDGLYSSKIYVKDGDGEKSSNSSTKEFLIEHPLPAEPIKEKPKKDEEPVIEPEVPKEKPIKEPAEKKTNLLEQLATSLLPTNLAEIGQALQEVGKLVEDHQQAINVVTSTGVLVSLLPFLFQVHSLADATLVIRGALGLLIGFFVRRKRKDWGVVYDSDTGKPIPMALVSIYNEEGKIADRRITDSKGTYGFLVPAGKYFLRVEKQGYKFIANNPDQKIFYASNYLGNEIVLGEEDVIKTDIPMQPEISTKVHEHLNREHISMFLVNTLFYIGLIFSFFAFFVTPGLFNAIILILYLIDLLLKKFVFGKVKWGTVFGPEHRIMSFATIKIFDLTGKLLARTITDEHGRYYLILEKGNYVMDVSSISGEKWHGPLILDKRQAVLRNITVG